MFIYFPFSKVWVQTLQAAVTEEEGYPFTQGRSAVKKPRRFGVYEVQTSELVHCEIINLR